MNVPTIDPAAIASKNNLFRPSTEKLSSMPYRVNPTNIVGRLTARDRLPASLISAPNRSSTLKFKRICEGRRTNKLGIAVLRPCCTE
jgi:hypothetical protein